MPRAILQRALLSLSVLGAATLASPQQPAGPAESTAPQPAWTPVVSTYRIGGGDVLTVFVWREPDLTRDVTVRIDGRISVPLLGDVVAAGKQPEELAEELRQQLSRFVEAPKVTVGITQDANSRFYVVGRVNRPGEYPMTGRTTFLQALAIAGGFAEFAKTGRILVVRRQSAQDLALFVDYKKLSDGEELEHNIVLLPGDTIVVP
jgi:polysaccharide export outer membrane protein